MVPVSILVLYLLQLKNLMMYEELICPVLGKPHSDVDENPIIRSGIAIIGLAKGPKPQTARIIQII